MPLTNAQYEAIIRNYEDRRTKNRRLLSLHTEQVYEQVDGYKDLDLSVSSISVEYGKRMLSGDDDALSGLKAALQDLSKEKNGF